MIGPADPGETLDVTVSLRRRPDGPPPPDPGQLAAAAHKEPLPHDEFVALYGASQDDIDKVVAFASANGLAVVEVHPARRQVVLRGTVAQMSAAFAVQLQRYEHELPIGRRGDARVENYRGREGQIHVPAELAPIIVGVFGLDNRTIAKHNGAQPPNTSPITTTQIRQLYNYPTNSAAGQTIGIIDFTGYASSDISSFASGITVTDILIGGATNPGSDFLGETTQDIEIAAGCAPGAAINVYISDGSQQGWVQSISRFAHPDASDSPASVLSSSYYICNGDDAATRATAGITVALVQAVSAAFQDAAIQGRTVCIASGDTGTDSKVGDGKAHVQYPGSDPWVLSVGGTTVGNISGGNFDEYVWNDPHPSNWGTTGGGISDFFPVPGYQANASVPASVNDSSHHGRGVPDVAGNANDASGYSDVFWNGGQGLGSGTSASAPQWAGLIAVINAALGVNVGFVNPAIYALGGAGFRDIVPGAGPADNSNNGVTGYPAGAGWDACTGWGSPDGVALLAALRSIYTRSLYFIVDKNTFGTDEVSDVISTGGGLYSNAFWLVLEGFSIDQVGAMAPGLSGPFFGLTGVTIFMDAAGPTYELPGDLYTPQRIRFPYNIIFSASALTSSFPAPGAPAVQELLIASVTIDGTMLSAPTLFELVAGADPYFTNVDPANLQPAWLSQDLRVFSAAAGETPLPGGPTFSSDPYQSIQDLLEFLNGTVSYTTPGPDLLNGLPGQSGYETGDSSVTPLNGSGSTNYNFAIARVRLQGADGSAAPDVRVFFRLFVAQSCDTDFQPATTYKSQIGTGTHAGKPVFPLASGSGLTDPSGQSLQTIAFFATDANGTNDYNGANANANIKTIAIPSGRDKLWAYFGCYLDVYDPANQSIFPGTHHCIVAEIAYDETPLQNSGGVTLSPGNTDKLAQRNLQITSSGNPSYPETHRIPQAFDTRASAPAPGATGALENYPDELMIDWGDVPPGSTASIYWPQADAEEVVGLATRLYGTHSLSAADPHTVQCRTTSGVTYVPIPFATDTNFAGLFTIDLPNTIRTRQEFNALVRRITSRKVTQGRRLEGAFAAAVEREAAYGQRKADQDRSVTTLNWRYVTGAFQVKIPVRDDPDALGPEENVLAIMKWRLQHMRPANRWRPVLERYVRYVADRVDGFGGDSELIEPSRTGVPVIATGFGEKCQFTGRVSRILFDCRGKFAGFVLTDGRSAHAFRCRARGIRKLAQRACRDGLTLSVQSGYCRKSWFGRLLARLCGGKDGVAGLVVRCC
jgi:hypothetical protein